MIADRCEIDRQIRADNKMLRELKAKVAKLAEAVEKSVPIIAETLEAIRNYMIFTQYHLLHNEMQKEVIHDWMNHFNPIFNAYAINILFLQLNRRCLLKQSRYNYFTVQSFSV